MYRPWCQPRLLPGIFLLVLAQPLLPLVVLALHSFWLPQIVHSATTDTKPPLRPDLVWGMSVLR